MASLSMTLKKIRRLKTMSETNYDYLIDQITKTVRFILKEATYKDSCFHHISLGVEWTEGYEPKIDYKYSKGDHLKLHRTPEEYEEDE
jgi:hypothetical protein